MELHDRSASRRELGRACIWVIKVGSSLITDRSQGLDVGAIAGWVEQMATLHGQRKQLLLVSSGAVAEGMHRLGWAARPSGLFELQAAAAVGQMGLAQAYESQFLRHGIRTAQVLLTHEDAADRRRYLNARSTLRTLLSLGVVPVINENDTVTSEEIRFGDNDTLGAMVANLLEAELYVILTDQPGMFDKDPKQHGDARLIEEARAGDPALAAMATTGHGALGRGGMATKVVAAAKAARSGTFTLIASGREPGVLLKVAQGAPVGTLLRPASSRVAARRRWLADHLHVRGRLRLDAGAVAALRETGRSLLPVGVTAVDGDFRRGDLVACLDAGGEEVARGLVNYPAAEARRIIGRRSSEIQAVLGYVDEPELIHRDNLVVL